MNEEYTFLNEYIYVLYRSDLQPEGKWLSD